MTTPGIPVLTPPIRDFQAYYASPDSDPFDGDYGPVLDPYKIDPVNTTAALSPAAISTMIYGADDAPTAFLLWHATPGVDPAVDPGRISMLHAVSRFSARLGRATTQWDGKAFALRGDVVAGHAAVADWKGEYLHQLSANVPAPSTAAIDTAFAGDPALSLLGPFNA